MTLSELKEAGEVPFWVNEDSLNTLSRGYLLEGETVKGAITRISHGVASELKRPDLEKIFFQAIWNNWLCLASPIWSNCSTERGLPLSCNTVSLGDSVDSIFKKNHELAMLSKNGAGVGIYMGNVRGRGSPITGNGKSEGVIPWIKVLETTTLAVSQGGTRKGASACYLPIDHPDYEEFIQIRRATGDHNRRARNMNIGACIDDKFLNEMLSGNKVNQNLWLETLKERVENGEPYLFFSDNVERQKGQAYIKNNLDIKSSNICVVPETKILTSNGYQTIGELENVSVDVWNGKEFSTTTVRKTGENKKILKVTMKFGQVLECTEHHIFYVQSEYAKSEVIKKRANELQAGDKLIKFELPVIEGSNTLEDMALGSKYAIPDRSRSLQSKLHFISDLLDSDGSLVVEKGDGSQSLQINSTDLTFLRELQLMLQTIAVNSKILSDNRLLILSGGVEKLLSLGLNCSRLQIKKSTADRDCQAFNVVKSVVSEGRYSDTYCFTEPIRNMGMFNGILTGNCNEIYLHTDENHTFVCCLSSLNVDRFDEWSSYRFDNGMSLPQLATWFLDGVLTEYIRKAKTKSGFEDAVRSAEKGRAIGIGVLGFHSYLQSKMIEMDSFDAMMANAKIFKFIDDESKIASRDLAKEYGEPEWCKGLGIRNTHLESVAPTASNSIISGGVSAGIEPISSNCFSLKSAKGTFIKKNRDLEKLLDLKGINTVDLWSQIIKDNGSVRNIKQLSEQEKSVFLTGRELNQHTLIKLAAQRQKFIDQGQSLNLFFSSNASAKYIHEVHLEAWKQGLKGLYYLRSETALNGSDGESYQSASECKACES